MINRRREPRRLLEPDDPRATMRLRSGVEVTIVNLSRTGVFVRGGVRLLPGARIGAHLPTRAGRVFVRGAVVRWQVARLEAASVIYEGALSFDAALDGDGRGYDVPEQPRGSWMPPGTLYPNVLIDGVVTESKAPATGPAPSGERRGIGIGYDPLEPGTGFVGGVDAP
jgi:hypothetical protein